ncbi:hypothetical protein PSHT_01320 [Puccinia striiformis]|uniref:Uncharacterized protein n=1 Tax=Puccinia striiformis TaxID=27350 RepID=A0A2S4WKR8_9BASI|nr:hypothetical protein PSHT_01320 [Puccinia striiformis]
MRLTKLMVLNLVNREVCDSIMDCFYEKATHKHGWWSNVMTSLHVLHVALLMTLPRSNVNTPMDVHRGSFMSPFLRLEKKPRARRDSLSSAYCGG